jgi:hypothetical protein
MTASFQKRRLLLVSSIMALILFAGITFYLSQPSYHDNFPKIPTSITAYQFVDGGTNNDKIVVEVVNGGQEAIEIASGYVNNQSVELSGNLTIPTHTNKTVTLSMPTDSLVAGRQYNVSLITANSDYPITCSPRYFFHHMYHPDASGPVEEGVITFLLPVGHHYSNNGEVNGDVITALVQNTGDLPITIMGSFVNGAAAIKTVDSMGAEQCVIEKTETKPVILNFPAKSLPDQEQNNIPLNVKLVTAKGNTIKYVDDFYYAFPISVDIKQPAVVEETAEIATVQFFPKYGMYDSMTATVHNFGSIPINISSCLLNGKATTIFSDNTIIEAGSTQTFTLQAGTLVQGSTYQVVLISSQNNAFVNTSTYSLP